MSEIEKTCENCRWDYEDGDGTHCMNCIHNAGEHFEPKGQSYEEGYNKAIDDFANFLHEKAKENNGLRLSSETRSWTHASIYDYVNEFREK